MEPQNFADWINKFNLSSEEASKEIKWPNEQKFKFHDIIVKIMKYNYVQKEIIRPYMNKMGIKTCVYCNAAYAVATKDKKATFQVDHFYPKSEYPFLCVSFFNLQPSCMHCNQIKAKKTNYQYSMYTDNDTEAELNPFKFSLDDEGIIKYMLDHNVDSLKFKLKGTNSENDSDSKNHSDFFKLDGLYPQFADVVEEVVWKGKVYNKAYRKQLENMFLNKGFSMSDFKRFYLGFYSNPEDVNKRPLTLLMQSIAKEMGLE